MLSSLTLKVIFYYYFMSLTKRDEDKVQSIIVQAISSLIIPQLEAIYKRLDGVERDITEVSQRMDVLEHNERTHHHELKDRLDDHVLTTHEQHQEVMSLLGHYVEEVIDVKEGQEKLEKRVDRVEVVVGI